MNTQTVAKNWNQAAEVPAPKDRAIWVRANVVNKDECTTWVEPYEGYAEWSESSRDWLDRSGMSIRMDFDAEFIPLEWMELADRAAGCPDSETDVHANIYFWDDELRRELGRAGFFALCSVTHSPTGLMLLDRSEGPYTTQAAALAALGEMLEEISLMAKPQPELAAV